MNHVKEQKIKGAELGQFLLWKHRLARIIGKSKGEQAILEMLENKCCPHCQGDLGKEQIYVIVASPQYQHNAEPIETIQTK
jgi:hypothetical protein